MVSCQIRLALSLFVGAWLDHALREAYTGGAVICDDAELVEVVTRLEALAK